MAPIDPKMLRQAQMIIFDSLQAFDKICQKHNLQYWLDSGTLLGAVRHQGFIPWDDDIDISMPVEDYHKFILVAQDELAPDMFLQTQATDPEFPFDYAKIRSDRATIIEFHEEGREVSYHQGVFLDIFPMLAIRDSWWHHKFYRFSFAAIRYFSAKKHRNNTIRGLFVKALHILHLGWKNPNAKVIYGGEMPDIAADFTYKSIFPLSKQPFEKDFFSAPKDSKNYLKQIYSFDFMELPPEDKRTIHAANIQIKENQHTFTRGRNGLDNAS